MRINISRKALKGVFNIEQYCKAHDIDVKKVTYLNCDNNEAN